MATIEIPEELRDWFRLATAREIKHGGEWIAGVAAEVVRGEERHVELGPDGRHGVKPLERTGCELADVTSSGRALAQTIAVGKQVFAGGAKASGDASCLAHIAETFCRTVIPEWIAEAEGPLEGPEANGEIRQIVSALSWAADEAIRLHVLAAGEAS
jgi:hypothetical protein